jgi:adenylate kinase family enzyme
MLDCPYVQIDSRYHGANWTPRPEFEAEIDGFTRSTRWVIEWQYTVVRPMLAARADTLVWLDLPAAVALARVTRRTIGRSRSQQLLWNGNVEPPLRTFFSDRDHIIRWAIRTRRTYARSVPALASAHPQLQVVRIRSQSQLELWLTGPLRESTVLDP